MASYGVNAGTPYGQAMQALDRSNRSGFLKGVVLPVAGAFGGGTLASMLAGGGGGAAGAVASRGYSSPGIFGGLIGGGGSAAPSAAAAAGKFSLGSMLNKDTLGLGVNMFASLMGNRAQGKANDKNLAFQLAAGQRAEALEAANMAEQRRQFDVSQADQRAALQAQNEMTRRQLTASEEERAFNRRLVEEKEARMAPYRQTAERARLSLMSMLGM